jgi:hypothetical protein
MRDAKKFLGGRGRPCPQSSWADQVSDNLGMFVIPHIIYVGLLARLGKVSLDSVRAL